MALNSVITTLILSSVASKMSNETIRYPQMVNNTFVIEVVSSIHRLYAFKNFVFYISKRLVRDTDTAAEFFHDFWDAFPTAPNTIITDDTKSMSGFLSSPSLCLVLTTERDDSIMEVAALSLKGVRHFKTIFILFPFGEKDDYLQTFEGYNQFYENIRLIYEWVWKKQFLNTMLLTVQNNVYIHEPYPTPNIVNKSKNWSPKDFFIDYSGNFRGYPLNNPVHYDLPRVFYMTRRPTNKKQDHISGVSGKLFQAFVNAINASFNYTLLDERKTEPVDINNIISMVADKQIDMSMHSYTGMLNSNAGTSYPIGINDWCIMVPFRSRSPEYMFLQNCFHTDTWYLLCFSSLYITLGIWLCSPSPNRDISLSFLQSICTIVLITPVRVLKIPVGRIRFLFVLLFLMGFFITNLYISKMTSFLTAAPPQPQINTVEDVINAELPIMIMAYEYEILESYNFPEKFLNLTVRANKVEMDLHRDHLNTSYGYSTQSDRWFFLNRQQLYLKKPLFRLSDICIGPYYHVFPMQKDSHLAQPLQAFIMAASQFGLFEHWEMEAFADALFLGYVRMMMVEEPLRPLTISFYRSLWFVWWFGLLTSVFIFCLEVKGITWQRTKEFLIISVLRLRDSIYEM